MSSHPTRRFLTFLCLIVVTFLINFSCSKDEETFHDSILNKPTTSVEDESVAVEKDTVSSPEIVLEEEAELIDEDLTAKVYENRTTVFPPINDAHLQGENGYDQNIVRLEENRRVSYLMFDLSQIDSIGGSVNESYLEFTIDSDDGNGTISVFKGVSSDWTEEELSTQTAPEADSLLGQLSSTYDVGSTLEVPLDTALVRPEVLTLVMMHEEGNDLAFASKEHPTRKGPGLKVSYNAPQDSEAIVFEEEITINDAETASTKNNTNVLEQNIPTEEITEVEATEEGTQQEEETAQDEKTSNDGTATEEDNTKSVEEETAQDEKTSNDGTATEEDNTKSVEEETAQDEETSDEGTAAEEDNSKLVEEATSEENPDGEAETTASVSTEEEEQAPVEAASDDQETTPAEDSASTEEAPEAEVEEIAEESQGETTEEETISGETTYQTDEVDTNSEADAPQNEAPRAIAGASPTSGNAPLQVTFQGGDSTDDQNIEQYVWDFRDGSTSYEANPVHTFEKPGTLEVRLTVTDAQGESHTDTVTITIKEEEKENEAPVAAPKASTASGEAPLEVQFTGDESTDDSEINSYRWDFKDGSSADTANPSHTFSEPGKYEVVLNVSDEQGLSNARIVVVTVTGAENEPPVAKASGTPLTGQAPLNVQFRGSDSTDDEGVVGYFWDFKDGSTTTNSNPSHTFNEPGEYDVKLDVRDKDGLTHSTSITVSVAEPASNNGGGDSGSGGDNGGNSGSGSSGGGDTGSGGSGSSGGGDSGSNDNTSNGVKASTFGYNSSDATNALKAAINSSHSTIIVDKQAGDWVVGSLYLNGIRNKKIIFEDGVVLRAKRGAFRPQDRLFQLVNSDNVEIQGYGATFSMNKSEYSGQQNHALAIVNSSNITVKGLTLTGAGGDGIYVSRHNDGEYCRNIVVDGVNSTNNSRQGMTVISVDGLQIKNSTFSKTSGESPSAGIDFEPESTRDRLDNITVTNCTFKDNNGPGIMFAVSKVNGSTRPIDATFRNITVSNNSISNPRVYPSEIDLGMSTDFRTNPVKGTITFDGLRVENSQWSAIYTKKTLESYHVNVKNAVFKNVSKNGREAAMHIGLLSYGNTSNANMGGFTFENVLIDYDGRASSLELFGPGHGNWNLANLKGEIRVRSPQGIRLNDNMNKLSSSSSSVNLRVVED